MSKLSFISVSLVAIGIAIILMEEMIVYGQNNNYSCPWDMTCTRVIQPESGQIGGGNHLSTGIFVVIAGAALFGLKATRPSVSKPNPPQFY